MRAILQGEGLLAMSAMHFQRLSAQISHRSALRANRFFTAHQFFSVQWLLNGRFG